MPKHKHADLMLLYAQDAATTDEPWLLWECNISVGEPVWVRLGSHPMWSAIVHYRRIPEKTDLEKYGVEKGDVWELTNTDRVTVQYADARDFLGIRGRVYDKRIALKLLFRRGVVDKL